MAAKRLAVPLFLILTIAFAVKLAFSSNEKHPAADIHTEVASEHEASPFFGDCEPAAPGLKFMSAEWAESHRDNLASGNTEGCDQEECYACHISAAPHNPGMQGSHISEYKNKRECYACHISPGNLKEGEQCPGYKPVEGKTCLKCHDYNYCNECHQAMKSHSRKFTLKTKVADEHGNEKESTEYHSFGNHWDFLDGLTARSCSASGCHSQQFCNDCHTKNEMPPLDHENRDAIQMHPLFVEHGMTSNNSEQRPDCSTCHSEMYCAACHLEGEALHPDEWEGTGHAVLLNSIAEGAEVTPDDRCIDCHKPAYCQKCHKAEGMMRSSHARDWVNTHAAEPESKTYMCNTCHTENFCSDCHEVRLPHTAEFEEEHKVEAMTVPDTCASCHTTTMCMDCHKTRRPKDHENVENFYKNHKSSAETIHQPGPEMEKAMVIRKKRLDKRIAAGKDIESQKYCNLCHDEREYCGMCHGISTAETAHKNPVDWEKQHQKTTSRQELEGCAHCHTMGYCYEQCHKQNEKNHAASNEADHRLCSKCHIDDEWKYAGESACAECHEDISAENELAIHMSDCTSCHPPHTWSIEGTFVCATSGCHEDINKLISVKEHREQENCTTCHNSAKAHEWASAVKFSACEKCHRKEGAEEGVIYGADNAPISELHNVDAHERCGDCHGPHDISVADPENCMACHREDPMPEICHDETRKCSDPSCHPFSAE